jgi:hypothetical protein
MNSALNINFCALRRFGHVSGISSSGESNIIIKGIKSMADCELISSCSFYNNVVHGFPGIADYLKNKYCKGIYWECARYKIYKEFGKDKVPKGLFPHEEIDMKDFR